MENNNQEERKRGGCLTAFLVVFIILQAIGLISNVMLLANGKALESTYKMLNVAPPTTTATIISIVFAIISLAGLILTMRYKKLGVYLYVGGYVVSLIISIVTAKSVATIVGGIVGGVVVVGIFVLLVKNIFAYMD